MNKQNTLDSFSDSKLGLLPPLTSDNIEFVENEIKNNQIYGDNGNDRELKSFFLNHKENTNRDIVLYKIMLIDYTNSTQLQRHKKEFSVFALADRLLAMKTLDEDIKRGDISLVRKISKQPVDYKRSNVSSIIEETSEQKKEINLFSFASKFCHYHNRICYGGDDYSIFDHVVAFAIAKKYLPEVKISTIDYYRKNSIYEEYHNLITRIIAKYDLGQIENIRYKLDHFLWYPNKKYYYNRGKNK